MCGIFGIWTLGPRSRKFITQRLVDGLARLEYRGYDSAGIAVDGKDGKVEVIKSAGNVSVLAERIQNSDLDMSEEVTCHFGISHTRWATHGEPKDNNAHPHSSDVENTFTVCHNGMLTNYKSIREMVGKGMEWFSETDTEVIAKAFLWEWNKMAEGEQKECTFIELTSRVAQYLHGSYAIVVKSSLFPGEAIAVRMGSPMTVGFSEKPSEPNASPSSVNSPEVYIASDDCSLVGYAEQVCHVGDKHMVHVTRDGSTNFYDMDKEMAKVEHKTEKLVMKLEEIMKGNFDHFMLKEIYEQPDSLTDTLRGRVAGDQALLVPTSPARPPLDMYGKNSQVEISDDLVHLDSLNNYLGTLRRARRYLMFACGTSYHASVATRTTISDLTGVPVHCELASDTTDRLYSVRTPTGEVHTEGPPLFRDDVCVFISQSGETKDTIDILNYCKKQGCFCVGITNKVGSYIARETDVSLHLNCGVEIGVASTKAYTSQILTLLMFGCAVGDSVSTLERRREITREMRKIPKMVKEAIDQNDLYESIANKYKDARSMLVLGRGAEFATCLEGALKIKELSYIHSEGIHTGELKHGPLALVDEHLPVVMVCTESFRSFAAGMPEEVDSVYSRVMTGFEQVASRKGSAIIISNSPTETFEVAKETTENVIRVGRTLDCLQPILNAIPLQLLSYHLAVKRGHNVDKPRNLAKSVTVN